jgi:hypothetical protein
METVYAGEECYEFRRFLGTHDGAMDSSDAMSTSLVWTKLQNTFYGWTKIPEESAKLMDHSAITIQRYTRFSDISLNDVSFTSMTVHMEQFTPPTRMLQFRCFLEPATVAMDSSDASMSTSLDWKYSTFLWMDETIPQGISETRWTPVQPPYRIFRFSDISLNDVSFTSMTVHMETVYAADKNVTRVSTFPGFR